MAKGNLFQGMARGKVGDVVFYRMNGEQMSRVRNRKPKNPRTNEQLYQRAIIASVMKFYSAGKEIFDHAFQGYGIGEQNMRRFNSLNARILRALIQTEVDGNVTTDNQFGRIVPPKAIFATPLLNAQVSEGTLQNNIMTISNNEGGNISIKLAVAPNEGETVAQYATRINLQPNDLFTVIALTTNETVAYKNSVYNSKYANQYESEFSWIRLRVKEDVFTNQSNTSSATWYDLFSSESSHGQLRAAIGAVSLTGEWSSANLFKNTNVNGCAALIYSKVDLDLRDNAFTLPIQTNKNFGIATSYLLQVWQDEIQKIGNSELILEGGNGDENVPAGQPMAVTEELEQPVAPVPVTLKKK